MPSPPEDGVPSTGAPVDFDSLTVEDVSLQLIQPTEEGDLELSPEFIASLREYGNIQPLLLGLRPDKPGEYELLNGHHRHAGLHEAGRATARCMIVRRVVAESERHELVVQLHAFQRVVKPIERAARAYRWLELNPTRTQKECAKRFGCSEGTLSRDLGEFSMGGEFQAQTTGLNTAVRQVLMAEKDEAKRRPAIEYALAPGPDGKRPSRDKVALFLKRNRGEAKRGRKPKALRGRLIDGREIVVGLKAGETTNDLIAALEDAVKRLRKYGDGPPDALGFVLR